jgi:hypothetical protein
LSDDAKWTFHLCLCSPRHNTLQQQLEEIKNMVDRWSLTLVPLDFLVEGKESWCKIIG